MRSVGTSRSLTVRLIVGVALPMVLIAVALGVGGTLTIRATVGSVNDRILEAAARGIADLLIIEDGEVALDLSPAIFGMLENTARDNVYYSVRQGGRSLTGYADLPTVAIRPGVDVAFADGRYLERDVRIVAYERRLPGLANSIVVEVAETLDARQDDARRLLSALVALEVALIAVAVLLLPLAVRWGLRPLARVRAEMDHRAASDLTPLPLADVPSELRDLVSAFNAMLVRLGEAMASMRRFTGDASHQMRTPLSILRTHVAVLRAAPPGSPEAVQSIDDIETGAVRLGRLIAQLLALARADNAASTPTPMAIVDLRELVAAVVDDHTDIAARAGIDLMMEVASGDHPIETVAPLASELLSNLVDNAIRHGGIGGVVRVSLRDRTVVIDDEGPGIPVADRDRVFTRFTRLTTYGASGGTGLGLSIARALGEAIGAELRLENGASGQGLSAVVCFP